MKEVGRRYDAQEWAASRSSQMYVSKYQIKYTDYRVLQVGCQLQNANAALSGQL